MLMHPLSIQSAPLGRGQLRQQAVASWVSRQAGRLPPPILLELLLMFSFRLAAALFYRRPPLGRRINPPSRDNKQSDRPTTDSSRFLPATFCPLPLFLCGNVKNVSRICAPEEEEGGRDEWIRSRSLGRSTCAGGGHIFPRQAPPLAPPLLLSLQVWRE